MYQEVGGHPAWQDYMARITAMRDDITRELLDGTLDKWGRTNDEGKRAVLFYLNRQLSYVPSITKTFEVATQRKREMDARSAARGLVPQDDIDLTLEQFEGILSTGDTRLPR